MAVLIDAPACPKETEFPEGTGGHIMRLESLNGGRERWRCAACDHEVIRGRVKDPRRPGLVFEATDADAQARGAQALPVLRGHEAGRRAKGGLMRAGSFGAELRRRREDAGVTLREVAERLELSRSYICDIEAGRRAPLSPSRIEALRGLIDVVGLNVRARREVIEAAIERWEAGG